MTRWTVTYGDNFLADAGRAFPLERARDEGLTFGEFMAGPVRAARLLFQAQWDHLSPQAGAAVRTAYVFSPTLGPVVFFGVLVGSWSVEIAGFAVDEDYWHLISGDPE